VSSTALPLAALAGRSRRLLAARGACWPLAALAVKSRAS
jgi:hypothetical protein